MKKSLAFLALLVLLSVSIPGPGQQRPAAAVAGPEVSLSSLYRLSEAKTFSIGPENLTGEKGKGGMAVNGTASNAARELGQGWKVNPFISIEPGKTFTLAEINGPGAIQHIWMTPTGNWRFSILRLYWDDEQEPSVIAPVGDFFAVGWGTYARISSLPVCVNPGSAFNSYWPMPFHKKAKITMENLDVKAMTLYYQIDYTLSQIPGDSAYFHAQFRRVNPLPYKQVYTIVDQIKGKGQYVGTYLAWGVHNNGWWGEGEVKFYIDGDREFPTINGTGTEDYFGGSYDFENQERHQYEEFTSPLLRTGTGDQAGRALSIPAEIRSLPLAHHGSGALRPGLACDGSGSRLAQRGPIPAFNGRYFLRCLLVSDRASCPFPQNAGQRSPRSELSSPVFS